MRVRLMALDPRGFSDVGIEIVDGRLLLSGTAPSLDHRIDAERIAWSVEQIQAVANEIEVGGATGLWRTSLDEAVTLQVRSRLIASSDVRAVNVNIETSRGVVYLMGLARDEAEMARREYEASLPADPGNLGFENKWAAPEFDDSDWKSMRLPIIASSGWCCLQYPHGFIIVAPSFIKPFENPANCQADPQFHLFYFGIVFFNFVTDHV